MSEHDELRPILRPQDPLRLALRRKLERRVEMIDVEQLSAAFSERIDQGYLYGDFQFSIEPSSTDFMHRGILSAYRPVPDDTPMPAGMRIRLVRRHDISDAAPGTAP